MSYHGDQLHVFHELPEEAPLYHSDCGHQTDDRSEKDAFELSANARVLYLCVIQTEINVCNFIGFRLLLLKIYLIIIELNSIVKFDGLHTNEGSKVVRVGSIVVVVAPTIALVRELVLLQLYRLEPFLAVYEVTVVDVSEVGLSFDRYGKKDFVMAPFVDLLFGFAFEAP